MGFGSNQGDKADYLRQALHRLQADPGNRDFRCSGLWETPPWGTTGQDTYLNAVVGFWTEHGPLELLHRLQAIEQALGRERPYRWAPRTVDLDLLLYGQQTVQLPELTVPHPLMTERLFVLVPLAEIAPELVLPGGTRLEERIRVLQEEDAAGFAAMKRTAEEW